MKHERNIRVTALCPDCGGDGHFYVGIRGPLDPDVRRIECETCGGTGEAPDAEFDSDDEFQEAAQ